MNIDSIVNGIVIDHITAGRGKEIYNLLHLSNLDCMVALITNATSVKMGRKDIIKIDAAIELDTDAPNVGLMATTSKRSYATCCMTQV